MQVFNSSCFGIIVTVLIQVKIELLICLAEVTLILSIFDPKW